jgi:hypothetical protein
LIKGGILRKHALALVIGCIVSGLLIAGCGDSDSSEADTNDATATNVAVTIAEDASLSKAEFVKKANAVCSAAFKWLEKQSDTGKRDYITNAVIALEREIDGITEVGAPSGDRAKIEAMLDRAKKTIEAVEANRKKIEPANHQLEKAEKLADKYGLKSCFLS